MSSGVFTWVNPVISEIMVSYSPEAGELLPDIAGRTSSESSSASMILTDLIITDIFQTSLQHDSLSFCLKFRNQLESSRNLGLVCLLFYYREIKLNFLREKFCSVTVYSSSISSFQQTNQLTRSASASNDLPPLKLSQPRSEPWAILRLWGSGSKLSGFNKYLIPIYFMSLLFWPSPMYNLTCSYINFVSLLFICKSLFL